jgi:hypothetical protein
VHPLLERDDGFNFLSDRDRARSLGVIFEWSREISLDPDSLALIAECTIYLVMLGMRIARVTLRFKPRIVAQLRHGISW